MSKPKYFLNFSPPPAEDTSNTPDYSQLLHDSRARTAELVGSAEIMDVDADMILRKLKNPHTRDDGFILLERVATGSPDIFEDVFKVIFIAPRFFGNEAALYARFADILLESGHPTRATMFYQEAARVGKSPKYVLAAGHSLVSAGYYLRAEAIFMAAYKLGAGHEALAQAIFCAYWSDPKHAAIIILDVFHKPHGPKAVENFFSVMVEEGGRKKALSPK